MIQPRFKKYIGSELKKPDAKNPSSRKGCKTVVTTILVILILGVVAAGLALKAPIKNSLSGTYVAPASRTDIKAFSRARWSLLDAQAAQLGTDLAWYHRSKTSPAVSVGELDKAGFRPFQFIDEAGNAVEILDTGPIKAPFGFALLAPEGTIGGYLRRGSMENKSILGRTWLETQEDKVRIDPLMVTKLHGQFLPDTPQFAEEYVCFLADVWDSAVGRFVAIYHKPPASFAELLDGLGLKANPTCAWPLDGKTGSLAIEGGIIDGNIIYWTVTLAGGATRGQARYYDTYSTTWDDPATPANITARTGSSPVVDPGLIEGQRVVMFNLGVLKNLLTPTETSGAPQKPQS